MGVLIQGTKRVTLPGFTWYYSFDKPPETFDYYSGYAVVDKVIEPVGSPFGGVAELIVMRKLNYTPVEEGL